MPRPERVRVALAPIRLATFACTNSLRAHEVRARINRGLHRRDVDLTLCNEWDQSNRWAQRVRSTFYPTIRMAVRESLVNPYLRCPNDSCVQRNRERPSAQPLPVLLCFVSFVTRS